MLSGTKKKASRKCKRKSEDVCKSSNNENVSQITDELHCHANVTDSTALPDNILNKDKSCDEPEHSEDSIPGSKVSDVEQSSDNQACSDTFHETHEDVTGIACALENVCISKDDGNCKEFSYVNLEASAENDLSVHERLNSSPSTQEKHDSVDYAQLLNEVESFLEDMVEPSAPLLDGSDKTRCVEEVSENISDLKIETNDEHLSDSVRNQKNIIKLKTVSQEEVLIPHSEEELSCYYYNPELHQLEEANIEFIQQELCNEAKMLHPFYKLLSDYLRAKICLKQSKLRIKELNEEMNKYISEVWTLGYKEIRRTAECGDKKSVEFSLKYMKATFNQEMFQNLKTALSGIRSILFGALEINSLNCLRYKFKITQYIGSLLFSCNEFKNLGDESPISLMNVHSNSHLIQCLSKLRECIGILFLFQRRSKIDMSSSFLQESRQWLTDLISVLIRTGSWKDHLFILNHVLRCPAGVSEWAASYIQFPMSTSDDPFSDPVINHMMTVMALLLQPVEKRMEFMNVDNKNTIAEENSWVVIESDDDDDDDDTIFPYSPLKENDMVLFFNQIPWRHIFCSVFGLKNGKVFPSVITVSHLLKQISFWTDFIKILHSGLKIYSTQRCRQFAKRLGRLIRDILQLITDELDMYKLQNQASGSEWMDRLQTEYDNLFFKSTKSIHSSQICGTWQFLAIVPYHMASSNVIMKLYSILQLDDYEKSNFQVDLTHFEEKFNTLPESEQFYLLSTLTNIALARNLSELELIKAILHQLFYIGFLGNLSKHKCYKNVKSLLQSLCSAHTFLISEILEIQNKEFLFDDYCDQSLSLYLWKELPIELWKPAIKDLQILSSWLLQPVQSIRCEVARLILSSLNYEIEGSDLFLPVEIHRIIALMIVKANANAVPDFVLNVKRKVSNLVALQEPDQALKLWSWNVLFKLRLHLHDQPILSSPGSFINSVERLKTVPDFDSIGELHHLVEKEDPIGCFVALMGTLLGHSVPLICIRGFAALEPLIHARKLEAAVLCLEYMTLMFLDCPDSLYKCEWFIFVLSQLVTADDYSFKLTKNFKVSEATGSVVLLLGDMIQNQLHSCNSMGINHACLIDLWMKSLAKLPLCTQEPRIIYLLDLLCKNAIFYKVEPSVVTNVLETIFIESKISPNETKSSLASLVNWMHTKFIFPLLFDKGYSRDAVWLFFQVTTAEQNMFEINNSLWSELLRELDTTKDKKTNVDSCLKKACTNLRIPVRSSDTLIIYKLCHQILETEIFHPIILLLWQKFFSLYLSRVPGWGHNRSVGDKFFHGITNQNLIRRMKLRLQETYNYFSGMCNVESDRFEYCFKCTEILKSFQLWLNEPLLLQDHIDFHSLPIPFDSKRLRTIVEQTDEVWLEYLDWYQVQDEITRSTLSWLKLKKRKTVFKLTESRNLPKKPLADRIQDGILRYGCPLSAPSLDFRRYSFLQHLPHISDTVRDKSCLNTSFDNVLEYAKKYMEGMAEITKLISKLEYLIRIKYKVTKSNRTDCGPCTGLNTLKNCKIIHYDCSSPAVVTFVFEQSVLHEYNSDLLQTYIEDFSRRVEHLVLPPPEIIGYSVLQLETYVRDLVTEYLSMKSYVGEEAAADVEKIGISLFYEFVKQWSKAITVTPSLKQIFEDCIRNIGKTFVVENSTQCKSVLKIIIEHPNLFDKLSDYFNPNVASNADFIEMYADLKVSDPKIRLALLSKFNLEKWMMEKKPRLMERSLLISAIGSGLKTLGTHPTDDLDLVEVFNAHLKIFVTQDFIDHFGQILNLLLEGSETQSIPSSTWFMFINSIVPSGIYFVEGKSEENHFNPGQDIKKLKASFTHYATHQDLLTLADIRQTMMHMANTFKINRLKNCAFGLYPTYQYYIEPIFIFCGLLSHSYVAETLKLDLGSLSIRITDQLWPLLQSLYSPWLVPYWKKQEKSETIKCVQELTDDKPALLPWINSYVSHASYCCNIFIESVHFVLDILPGVNGIIHKNFLYLPWNKFFPNLQDVELMVKVVELFLPMAHSFLGNVFIEIKWTDIIKSYVNQDDLETTVKMHTYLLHLLVKLPCEPSLKQNGNIVRLLTEAQDYSWHLVDSSSYDSVLNWFVMSCDPRIVLMNERSEYYEIDSKILEILQICAGYLNVSKPFHPTTLTKRLMFIRANIKWLTTAHKRFKCKDSNLFFSAVVRILDEIEGTVDMPISNSQKTDETALLLSEFLSIFKEEELNDEVEKVVVHWLSKKRRCEIIFGFLRALKLTISNYILFANIAEACVDCYFESAEQATWTEINSKLVLFVTKRRHIQDLGLNQNFLILNSLCKYIDENTDVKEQTFFIHEILHVLTVCRKGEAIEPKVVLIISQICRFSEIIIRVDEAEGVSILSRLFRIMIDFVNKENGLLSVFGFRKQESFTSRFRCLCLVVCCGIITLIKESYPLHLDKVDETVMQRLQKVCKNNQYEYQDISHYITLALDEVRKISSVEEIVRIVNYLGFQLFNKIYLQKF